MGTNVFIIIDPFTIIGWGTADVVQLVCIFIGDVHTHKRRVKMFLFRDEFETICRNLQNRWNESQDTNLCRLFESTLVWEEASISRIMGICRRHLIIIILYIYVIDESVLV